MSADDQERLLLTSQAQRHVDAYIEYHNIVGDADGGVPLSEEEYAEFRRRAVEARKNRLYVVWRNPRKDLDCRVVGPSSMCFCGHRYRSHATDRTKDKDISCRAKGCPCTLYEYVPVRGTQDVKCHCKHSYEEHRVTGARRCRRDRCGCQGFASSLRCSCGDRYSEHVTVFETREERIAGGRRVDNLGGPEAGAGVAAMGGLTCFSDLVDGVERLGGGGCGRPPVAAAAGRPPPGALARLKSRHGLGQARGGAKAGRPAAVPPRKPAKLGEADEMAMYGAKYGPEGQRRQYCATGQRKPAATPAAGEDAAEFERQAGDHNLSQARRYAAKKRLQLLRARAIREQRAARGAAASAQSERAFS